MMCWGIYGRMGKPIPSTKPHIYIKVCDRYIYNSTLEHPNVIFLNYCYEIVLTCINYCRSIVVIVYCLLSIVVILINIILVMCDIDYCRSYSIMQPPCMLTLTQFTASRLLPALSVLA